MKVTFDATTGEVTFYRVPIEDPLADAYANAFPNANDPNYRANEVIHERRDELTAATYADIVDKWVSDGATIIGGCCDMYPEHIAELARRYC